PEGPEGSVLARLFPPTHESGSVSTLIPSGIELGQFKIEERIGRGGMGAVFRAIDTTLQRQVALKLLAPSQCYDASAVKRFRNEARAAARLNHENIATVHFIGEDQGLHFIAFEFVTGSNIRERIRRRGKMSVADTVNYALQIAYSLKHLSAMAVVHRDIKPSNIIITPKGRAKLVDLGLARKDNSESHGDLTLPGTTLGTFDYISPEQAKDPRSVDVRSDIYSLGCTMYHMLTGQPPYPDGTVLQKLLEHQGVGVPDPAVLNSGVPEQLSIVVRRMMNSDRNRRYQTPDQLIRDLTNVAGSFGLKGVNPEGLVWIASRAVRSRSYAALTGWVATLGILLGVVGILHQFPQLSQNISGITEVRVAPEALTAGQAGPVPESDVSRNPEQPAEVASAAGPPGSGSARIIPIPIPVDIPESEVTRTGPETTTGSEGISAAVPSETGVSGLPGAATDTADFPDTGGIVDPVPETGLPLTGPGEEPDSGATLPVATQPQENFEPFIVRSQDQSFDRRCRTLNAACLAVEDGGVIQLDYSGVRDELSFEKPVRITRKNITIMASEDKLPVVSFLASDLESTPGGHMISVLGGRVSIVGVQFQLSIPEDVSGTQYSLFGVSHPARLELSRVAGTIQNRRRDLVRTAFISSIVDSSKMPSDMTMPVGSPQTMDVETTDCLFRGDGSFAQLTFQVPAEFTLSHSAFALQDDLIRVDAGVQPTRKTDLRLTLKHVTAAFHSSLVRFHGYAGQEVNATVHCLSRNSIHTFTGPADQASLIVTEGDVSTEDARKMLAWEGDRNFYDQMQRFWLIEGVQGDLGFEDWLDVWGPSQEVGAANVPIPWAIPEWVLAIPLIKVTSVEFGTDRGVAVLAATDGSSVGCDISRLPEVYRKPSAPEGPVDTDTGVESEEGSRDTES
ncbi:MAG: serine/threonine-protein kinase, partial [Planctomycetaceae bacterium]